MELNEIHLDPPAGFYRDYLNQRTELNGLFDYTYESADWLVKRADELSNRAFDATRREKLVTHLLSTHKNLHKPEAALASIAKLRQKESLVIVGGQQAGLLTGPLFTLYKALTVLIAAKQQEKELNVPVVPVFWVAGEDHDFEEIRFVYREKQGTWRKHPIQDEDTQSSASLKQLPHEELFHWLDGVFEELPETDFTCDLIEKIRQTASACQTYTDFFIQLMNELFLQEGLIFVDANHPELRRLETDFFKEMILHVEELQANQQKGVTQLVELGYNAPILTEEENAHLFITVDQKRVRLDYEDGLFTSRNQEVSFSKQELLSLVEEQPERFSNNVVSRPLMQEWVLPVLAFIPGPGELAYWGTLKPAFNQFGWNMPPLIPRLQVTIIPRSVKKWVEETGISYQSFLEGDSERLKQNWIKEQHSFPIDEVVSQVKENVDHIHQPLRQLAEKMDPTLYSMSEKNVALIMKQIQFLESRMNRHILDTHKTTISQFDHAVFWMKPLGSPQERILHPIILLNIVGQSGLKQIFQQPLALNGVPKLLFL
ncbi:bacillithiol biosynthesis cysteine-adding enzyme BshC [Alkalicoccobacillus plakortidis]|uniref:Putative cysteine ligase BshC n=1 Tax=Alkalicoccobacillus plakortidis TaxID=444060 RepID=A0ABT0XI00_9BACI|nr:bacillithiol biosynthesis cysteine-adding enzyme BshC [Alkalicoccobacillus plakortidis]MCM2674832.1 bacillithiol biosynthesis cysteine-adding enzyme BshC [Alkalicoccobacillus plakortidis]